MNRISTSARRWGALLSVVYASSCVTAPDARSTKSLSDPVTFDRAPGGEHIVNHAEGVCNLCDLYYKARTGVVRVRTGNGQGAGIVVTSTGRIVTNAHVVEGDDALIIETYHGDRTKATVLRADAQRDVALVSVEREAQSNAWSSIPVQRTALPRVGTDVYVIGHPAGMGWTVSRGVVSAIRNVGDVGRTAMIQTDAAISPGNSGGPLLDREGHLLGLVVAKLAGRGVESIAFAIPASEVAEFLAEQTREPDEGLGAGSVEQPPERREP